MNHPYCYTNAYVSVLCNPLYIYVTIEIIEMSQFPIPFLSVHTLFITLTKWQLAWHYTLLLVTKSADTQFSD